MRRAKCEQPRKLLLIEQTSSKLVIMLVSHTRAHADLFHTQQMPNDVYQPKLIPVERRKPARRMHRDFHAPTKVQRIERAIVDRSSTSPEASDWQTLVDATLPEPD